MKYWQMEASSAVVLGIVVYVVCVTNFFRTSYSIHSPVERWIQRQCTSEYLEHAVSTGRYERKICAFGRDVALLLATIVALKYDAWRCGLLNAQQTRYVTILMWTLAIVGGVLMNLNFSLYLLPPAIIDIVSHLRQKDESGEPRGERGVATRPRNRSL
jgi:hypothetical protein